MRKILVIAGSYRMGGNIDQAVDIAVQTARAGGAEVDVVQLREVPIEFCLNCRACTQNEGEAPGACVLHDGMHELIDKIERADALILASPTNFYSVTAIFKRFMERLVVYAFWPWGMPAPQMRKQGRNKKALLLASSAAPALWGKLIFSTFRQLALAAKTVGAKPVARVFIGHSALMAQPRLKEADRARVEQATRKLLD